MTSTTFSSAAGLTLLINLISIWFSEHRSAFHVILWIPLVCLLVYLLFTVVIPLILGIIALCTDDDDEESDLERQLEALEDDDEEPFDPEAVRVTDLSSYWYCEHCGKAFRNYSGDPPEYCPSCGRKARIAPIEKMCEEYDIFFCPRCGEALNIADGSAPHKCSRCGWEPKSVRDTSKKEADKKGIEKK